MLTAATVGCTHYGVSGPDDLGLAARFESQTLPTTLTPGDPNPKLSRNELLNQWIVRSDFLCSDYLLVLSRSIRDTRLATDFTATVLAGLATIFAQPAVTRPLAGAATIALGVGADIQSDLFMQQAGDVVSTAIQAVRTRARTELQKKQTAEYEDYTIGQGLADVQRYASETCNLNVGLNEIRASLNIIGPVAPLANNPIIPLTPRGTETGAVSSSGSATLGTPGPVATTIIPPNVQNTPEGGIVVTPGKVVTNPITAPPSVTTPGGAAPGGGAVPPTRPPSRRGAAQANQASNPPTPLIPIIGHAQGNDETALERSRGQRIQQALCMPPDGPEVKAGDFGPETRQAIQSWRSIKRSTPSSGPLNTRQITDLLLLGPCDRALYQSYFERSEYSSEDSVKALQEALAKVLAGNPPVPQTGKLNDTRTAIRAFQKLNSLPETGIMTAGLEDAISRSVPR
jgi:hypothetical protein